MRFRRRKDRWLLVCEAGESHTAEALVVIAGDAFGGPRVEGAFLSGWAAAEWLLDESQESP